MQWGMNKGVTPYSFGANIGGNWYGLGTISPTGVWGLSPFSLSIPTTEYFFVNNGASSSRLGDRVFAGGANTSNGFYPFTGDWLTNYNTANPPVLSNGNTSIAYFATKNNGAIEDASQALTVAARSALKTSASATIYPLNVVNVNDNTTLGVRSWGIYLESHAMNNIVEETTGAEYEVVNRSANIFHDPYGFYRSHQVTNLQLGCGAELSASGQFNCGYALGIFNNPMPFNSGIIFQNNSLNTARGFAEAISLPANYWIDWYSAENEIAWRLGSTQSSGGSFYGTNDILLTNNGIGINADGYVGYQGLNKAVVIGDSSTAGYGIEVNGSGALGIASGTTYSTITEPRSGATLYTVSNGETVSEITSSTIKLNKNVLFATGVPSASSCGTSPGITSGSSSNAGRFTIGGGATSCTITFDVAYNTVAFCTVSPTQAPGSLGEIPYISGTSKTGFTMSGGVAGRLYNYTCMGN